MSYPSYDRLNFLNKTDVDRKKQTIILYAIEMNSQNEIQQLI